MSSNTGDSRSVSADAPSESSQLYTNDSGPPSNSAFKMMCRGKEVVCLIALLLTSFAAIQNKPMKFGRIQQPKSLFSRGSVVQDWPGGQLEMLQMRVSLSELSLVFFYAPWCAESMFTKDIYEKVARVFHEEAYFAAVNCWQPVGECRLQYSKVNAWPILMAYYKDTAIQYMGPWSVPTIMSFIGNLISPVKRLKNVEDLNKMKAEHDAVLVGFFRDVKNDFLLYVKAALQWLEHDPFQDIKFTVVTGSTALKFNISNYPAMKLHLWNETMNYPGTKWSVRNITAWVKKLVRFNNHWIDLPVRKSSLLINNLKKAPTVLVFTPRDYILKSHVDYFLIKQAAWEYSSCPNNTGTKFPNYNFITSQGKENWRMLQEIKAECRASMSVKINISKGKCHIDRNNTATIFSNLITYHIGSRNYCPIVNRQGPIKYASSNIFMVGQKFDAWNAKEILNVSREKFCSKVDYSLQTPRRFNLSMPSFYGMSCKYHNSLTFLMLDSFLYKDVFKKLTGGASTNLKKTAVFILDNEAETTYRMNATFSASSLYLFVKDFHERNLKRQSQSEEIKLEMKALENTKINIAEANFRTVKNLMELSKSTLVVLFYSSQCALCTLISQTLLKIAKLLKPLDITYLRIDGDKHELPWEYVMESYPTLILVPRNKTLESRIFPQDIEANVKNILGFILANLPLRERLQALAEFCHTVKVNIACRSCISLIRKETLKSIQANLQLWRKVDVLRNQILRRLQILLEAYVLLFRISDNCNMTYFKELIISLGANWKE